MMTNEPAQQVPTQSTIQKKLVYAVTEKGERTFWTKVGVGFVNRDGSLTLRLDAMPINGTLQVRDEDTSRRAASGGAT